METEEWKKVILDDIEYNYEVSNFGNVRNLKTKKLLKTHIKNGYKNICMVEDDDNKKYIAINRLVLIVFKGIDKNKKICNHIDGDKINNKLSNLEWTTQKENIKHANENNLIKIPKKSILKYDLNDNFIAEYNSVYDAVKELNITRHAIGKVLSGKNQTAGGFKWKYKDEKYNKIDIPKDAKNIKNYPNYMVTKEGKIYSIPLKRYLQPVLNDNGYYYVTLCTGNTKEKKNCYVHTIVADTFIPKINDKPLVNHIDGNKINNNVQNLEWVNNSENMKHAIKLKKSLQN
jgi:hypothetical protein